MDNSQQFPLIAKTMAELEDVLAEELIALGANDVEIGTRMVSFTGDQALMYKANLHCRTALRILKPIHTFKADSAEEVYAALKELNWEEYMSLDTTFSIDAVVYSHIFTHSKFVAYKVKDAIVDHFTEKYQKRPSVGITNPDLMFSIHISHNKCTLALDSSGESLHKRGYRIAQTDAPLSEVLAAGMILKSGWRGESVFIDPMCGSGTILIEAALIAAGIPPGIYRENFAFEKWVDFDEELFSEIFNDDSTSHDVMFPIIGSDISAKAIDIAERNIKNAGLKKYITLSVKPFQSYEEAPAESGVLMTNPPYGERLHVEELDALYSMIGERLKHVFTGYSAYVLSYKKEGFDNIGLKPSKRFFLYNGALECEMREYEIFAGKRNMQPRQEDSEEKKPRDEHHNERNSKEGYRRSKRNEERENDGFTDERPKREFREKRDYSGDDRRHGERRERSFDRDKKSFDKERKPFDRDKKTFDRERKPFNRDSKPFDRERKPFDRDSKPSFNRERKPFDKDGKPRERSFDRDKKPFDRERKPFDKDNRTRDFKKKDFGNRESRKADNGQRGGYGKPFAERRISRREN